jgi:CRISPR/Cas system-associated endonuclease Cas1
LPRAVGVHDLVDVFRAQMVLRLAFAVFAVGVDEQHVVAGGRACLVEHQNAGRNAGAVEQVAGQADHGFQVAAVDEVFARLALFAAAEQHAVGHDGGQAAIDS